MQEFLYIISIQFRTWVDGMPSEMFQTQRAIQEKMCQYEDGPLLWGFFTDHLKLLRVIFLNIQI